MLITQKQLDTFNKYFNLQLKQHRIHFFKKERLDLFNNKHFQKDGRKLMLDFLDLDEIEPFDYDIDYNEYSITTKPDDEHVTDVKDMSDLIEFIDIYMDKYIKNNTNLFSQKEQELSKDEPKHYLPVTQI